LSKFSIDQKIFFLLKIEKGIKDLLTTEYKNKVKSAIEILNGVYFDESRSLNKGVKLVAFKNGVLNINTKKLFKHDPKYYLTYSLNLKYDTKAKLSNEMVDFLLHITNKILILLSY
jgi:phage/plasmid-associated DNA primase